MQFCNLHDHGKEQRTANYDCIQHPPPRPAFHEPKGSELHLGYFFLFYRNYYYYYLFIIPSVFLQLAICQFY